MKNRFYIIFLFIVLGIVYWSFLSSGVRVANDFPMVSKELLDSNMDLPRVWSEKGAEGLGEYTSFFLWGWPLTYISGFLSNFGLSFAILERVLLIFILFLAVYGIWKLGESFNLSYFSKSVAAIFYCVNTYIILLLDGGQLSVGLAYAFFPVSFAAIEKSISGNLYKKILAGLSITILGFLDLRLIYILSLLILVRFLYQFIFIKDKERVKWIISWITTGIVSILVILGLNFYWLLPLFLVPISDTTYSFFTQTQFSPLGNIGHSIMLLSPHWFKNVFGQISPLRFEFVLIPILVFLAPILKRKNHLVVFWLIVALIGIFLSKGAAEPQSSLYPWLFNNIPFFSIFRDSSKFLLLVALSYALLLGVTAEEIAIRVKSDKIKIIFFLSLVLYFIYLVKPIFLNQMTGTFSQPPLKKEFSELSKILENDKNFSRIFWIPHMVPLGYSSLIHPTEEASRLSQKRPFAIGTKGTYETFNFLREAPYMGEIFDIAGIGYIVYPPLDPRRDDVHPDNVRYYQTFSKQLSKLRWLTKVDGSPINLWQVNTHNDKFFITPNIWWVIGSDDLYEESTKSASLKLSQKALIFVEEHPGLGRKLGELPEAKIVLNNKNIIDLAASFIDPPQIIFPAKKLGYEPDVISGWWKREAADLIRWRDFLQTKYGIDNIDFDLGGGWAVGEGELELRINPSTSLGTGNQELREDKILLARVLESTRSGQLKFYQGDNLVGQIITKNEGNNVRWFEVGSLITGKSLIIQSFGDINVVNALAILDKNDWMIYQDKVSKFQKDGKIVNFDESKTEDVSVNISYKQINPTKYIVKVTNLTKPAILVFSQNYDKLWKANGQSALPIYSLLNGFKIEKDGDYIVEFAVQNWVYPGLIISVSTLAILIFLLIKMRKSNPS